MAPWPCSACQRRARIDEAEEHRRRGNEHLKAGRRAEAISAYDEAIRLRPKEGAFWLNRSIAFRQQEDWAQAERDAATAAELQPGSEKAVYGRALALQKLGRNADALTVCSEFLKRDPDNKPLLQLRRSIEQAEKQAATAAEKPAVKPAPKTKSKASKTGVAPPLGEKPNVDYSKWKTLEDSDEEKEEKTIEKTWQGKNPSLEERLCSVEETLNYCRSIAGEASSMFPNSREPENVKVPADYRSNVGVLELQELAKFNSRHTRQLVSIYGDIFDVSSRPDQYGVGGPFAYQTGKDVTWAVITGRTAENCNRFFDIFKLDDNHLARYLHIMCQKIVAFENQFGEPVGRLESWADELRLPPAPLEEIDECPQQ